MKQNRAKKLGIETRHLSLPVSTSTERLTDVITRLSADSTVHGILLQHPVPEHINERAAFEAIAPEKDVDGVTTHSFASMAFGSPGFESCTPGGIIKLLDAAGVDIAGKHAVVVGRSPILGKPAALLLLSRDATVTVCHSKTRDLPSIVRSADIVVAAVGKPEFIRGSWLKAWLGGHRRWIQRGQHRRRRVRRGPHPRCRDHSRSRRRGSDDHRGAALPDCRCRIPATRHLRRGDPLSNVLGAAVSQRCTAPPWP
jgi:hypothetical protein